MKYYITERCYILAKVTRMSSGGAVKGRSFHQVRDKQKDTIAYSWQNRRTGKWQIYTKLYDAPNSTAKLYDKFYNTPQLTRAACDAHMYYIHLKDGWEDPACEAFRELVAKAIINLPFFSDVREVFRQGGIYKSTTTPHEWGKFERFLGVRGQKEQDVLWAFLGEAFDITPRRAWPHIRRMYFKLCDSLHIDPRAAGFEESIL